MKKAYPITRKQKTDGNGNGSRPFLEAFFFSLFKEKLMTGFVIFIYTYADGTMLKTRKGKLMEELESRILSEKPNHVDVTIIDATFFSLSVERTTSIISHHRKSSANKSLHRKKKE